jgi:hypothetical protein
MSPHSPAGMSTTELYRALHEITEVLAGELGCASSTPPDWSHQMWRLAPAVAAMHGISPLLSRMLHWQGPASWVNFLDAQRIHTERRHTRVLELLQTLDEGLRSLAIGGMALKGVALHTIGIYRPGERPMADVDLLVHPRDAERTVGLLKSLGFYESSSNWKERAFTPVAARAAADLGEHANNDLKIELHDRICERLPLHITDVTDCIFPHIALPGLNAYPSRASLMIHLLLHASGAIAFQSLRILHLHDIALLSARMTETDWEDVVRSRPPGRALRWAWPPLAMTERYYSLKLPTDVRTALSRACPRLLKLISQRRQVSDVSYSYPRIDAFPGIEWSQSLSEMTAFIFSRIRPSEQHLAWREVNLITQRWAASAQWSSLSQGRRIARWIITRPLRPVTLHAVRAALAQTQ